MEMFSKLFNFFFFLVWKVQTALKGSGGNKGAVSEGVEASIIYVRFKAAASEVITYLLMILFISSRINVNLWSI